MKPLKFSHGPFEVCEPNPSDLNHIIVHMRAADKQEVFDSHGWTPRQAVLGAQVASECKMVLRKNGSAMAFFGISRSAEFDLDTACVWLLGTGAIDANWLPFCRIMKKVLRAIHAHYPTLFNFVGAENIKYIRWLSWIGAHICTPTRHGHIKKPFCYFTLTRRTPCVLRSL